MIGDDAWTALAANLPATIAALGALFVAIGTFVQSWRTGKKTEQVAAETAVIKTNTDGSLSELRHELELARQEIDSLKTAAGVAAVQTALATPTPQQVVEPKERVGNEERRKS